LISNVPNLDPQTVYRTVSRRVDAVPRPVAVHIAVESA